eukprot:TRINITY_DN8923_c0_g1_i4.p1 TRINITY_DN8923_c0_g1~~TRINITY_DN8923_c0_g1_i4.p1  ORF type:complete len:251 (-),score=21.45 TRINITY_DN8923_c0_g1_i4:565-1317(-)
MCIRDRYQRRVRGMSIWGGWLTLWFGCLGIASVLGTATPPTNALPIDAHALVCFSNGSSCTCDVLRLSRSALSQGPGLVLAPPPPTHEDSPFVCVDNASTTCYVPVNGSGLCRSLILSRPPSLPQDGTVLKPSENKDSTLAVRNLRGVSCPVGPDGVCYGLTAGTSSGQSSRRWWTRPWEVMAAAVFVWLCCSATVFFGWRCRQAARGVLYSRIDIERDHDRAEPVAYMKSAELEMVDTDRLHTTCIMPT